MSRKQSKHSEKIPEFIILRSAGKTYSEIANILDMSLRTCERWGKDPQISEAVKAQRAEYLDSLKERARLDHDGRIAELEQTVHLLNDVLTEKNLAMMSASDAVALKIRTLKALREEEMNF